MQWWKTEDRVYEWNWWKDRKAKGFGGCFELALHGGRAPPCDKTQSPSTKFLLTIIFTAAINLFFVLSSYYRYLTLLQLVLQKLLHREGHSLPRCHSHHSRCDSFVKCPWAFLLEHILCDCHHPRYCC